MVSESILVYAYILMYCFKHHGFCVMARRVTRGSFGLAQEDKVLFWFSMSDLVGRMRGVERPEIEQRLANKILKV